MRTALGRRLTYANVMATLAFFLALGGGAYAAATIGSSQIKRDAILSRHIKNGQVKNADLAANAVGTAKVIDGSISSAKLAPDSVRTGNVADGSLLAQDFKPGELPGSQQFNLHLDRSKTVDGPTVNGIRTLVECFNGGGVGVHLLNDRADPDATIYASGYQSEDLKLAGVHYTGRDLYTAGNSTADVDVIAYSTARQQWTHFLLGSYSGGAAGCNFWGLITSPAG